MERELKIMEEFLVCNDITDHRYYSNIVAIKANLEDLTMHMICLFTKKDLRWVFEYFRELLY